METRQEIDAELGDQTREFLCKGAGFFLSSKSLSFLKAKAVKTVGQEMVKRKGDWGPGGERRH